MGKKADAGGGKKDAAGGASGDTSKRDAELNAAIAHSQLMTVKLEATEKARNDYRENCKKVTSENEKLHESLYQAEKDTIEVITYLKKQDMIKDEALAQMNQMMLDLKQENKAEKQQIVKDFTEQVSTLEAQLQAKSNEVKLIQGELKMVQEFRRKRQQMQIELENIRESLFETNKEHKRSMHKMEQKFFEEKLRLEQEANKKLSELAERAHSEAITKLDQTTRDVYKENVRLNDALNTHTRETSSLQKDFETLKTERDELKCEKQLNDATVRMKITEVQKLKQENRLLREKVDQLETAMNNMANDFQKERKKMRESTALQVWSSKDENERLKKVLAIKDVESNRVKLLAKNIIEERSELEIFFHHALEQVRTQIDYNRSQYVTAARDAYQRELIAASNGNGEYPQVRTFNRKNDDKSTNSVMHDLKQAENTNNLEGKKDIRDLTWEQKEKVLRLIFARMNQQTKKVKKKQRKQQLQLHNKNSEQDKQLSTSERIKKRIERTLDDTESASTFITQQPSTSNTAIVLPVIGFN